MLTPRPKASPLASLLAPLTAWAQYNVQPSVAQMQRIREEAQQAQAASPQECFVQLTKLLQGPYVPRALQALLETGVLDLLLPEVAATSKMGPLAGSAFKDVWEHTKTVVWQSVPRPSVRWAALLHDIGKVPTIEISSEGKVSFMDHERVSFELFETQVQRRIAFPEPLATRIGQIILHHQRPCQYESTWTDAAVRRLDRDYGEYLDELLHLSRADITSKRPGRRKSRLAAISELSRRIRDLRTKDAARGALPKGLGQALIASMGIPPGPKVGQVRARIQAAIDAGELAPGLGCDAYVAYARGQGWLRDTTLTR